MIIKTNDRIIKKQLQIASLVELFVKNYLSENTKIAYANDLEHFFQFCFEVGWKFNHPKDISSIHLREYRDFLLEGVGLSINTVIRKMVAIRGLMTWCFHEGLIEKNPLLNVKLPKSPNMSTTQAFTDIEVRNILDIPNKQSPYGALHYVVLVFLFYLGLRKEELISIKIKDFREERNHYVLWIYGKGGKIRKAPITPAIKNAIESYKTLSGKIFTPNDYLFQPIRNNYSNRIDKPLHRNTVDWVIKSYSQKAGINKKISPHSCRATVISHLLDNRIPIREIAIFAGHSSIQTTSIYDKRKEDLDKNPAYKVNY